MVSSTHLAFDRMFRDTLCPDLWELVCRSDPSNVLNLYITGRAYEDARTATYADVRTLQEGRLYLTFDPPQHEIDGRNSDDLRASADTKPTKDAVATVFRGKDEPRLSYAELSFGSISEEG